MTIAATDLQYVAGSLLGVGGHPRSWAMSQWGVMVTYEIDKTLRSVYGADSILSWDPQIAEAARHGGKFFDGKDSFDQVVEGFRSLISANVNVFYPSRRARMLDFLRDDVSFITDGTELLLTSISGQFMLGFPPERVVNRAAWGPHVSALIAGVGQAAAAAFDGRDLASFAVHGNHDETTVTWWDGKLARALPAAFAGELSTELALSLITIYSTVQAARRWARTSCCGWCASASLKHRYVVLHHAVRSLEQLSGRTNVLGSKSTQHLSELLAHVDVRTVVTRPFRKLRNGWFHLGLADIARQLPDEPDTLSPVSTYTGMETLAFIALVDRALDLVSLGLDRWLLTPAADGSTIFDRLRQVTV